jgi:hypothetical protein
MTGALLRSGCKIVHSSSADSAPFVIAFETPEGERLGIVAYAFLATRTPTKNRPKDERSFQIKYGSKESYASNNEHELWQDPLGMFTTMLLGIDVERGICVSADPIVHSPTKFFIRVEYKDEQAEAVEKRGWFAWERAKRSTPINGPRVETMVGADREHFLDLVRFERAARGLDPGNRLILAEGPGRALPRGISAPTDDDAAILHMAASHPIATQFDLTPEEILDLIASDRYLHRAVRGSVAEKHLQDVLSKCPGVTACERMDAIGSPDLRLRFRNGPPLTIECKNVSRDKDRFGNPKLDFQRTRAAKGDPCSRYYRPCDFDLVAGCLHAITAKWDFKYVLPGTLPPHNRCPGRINSNLRVDNSWSADAAEMFRRAYAVKGITV